jgi:hypothetical protein
MIPASRSALRGLVGDAGCESLVELGAERDALDEPLCVSPQRAYVCERLLVLEPVGGQGALGARADVRDIDAAGRFERGDVVPCWAISIVARG